MPINGNILAAIVVTSVCWGLVLAATTIRRRLIMGRVARVLAAATAAQTKLTSDLLAANAENGQLKDQLAAAQENAMDADDLTALAQAEQDLGLVPPQGQPVEDGDAKDGQ